MDLDKRISENRIIGAFTYVLGILHGRKRPYEEGIPSGWVDLIQQTGLDSRWGDLIAQEHTRFILVEFKSTEGFVKEEFKKDLRKPLITSLKEHPLWKTKSKTIHYIAYRSAGFWKGSVVFQPYVSIIEESLQPKAGRCEFAKFVETFVNGTSIGAPYSIFNKYLGWAAQFESDDDEGGGGAGLALATDGIEYRIAGYSRLVELAQNLSVVVEAPVPDQTLGHAPMTPPDPPNVNPSERKPSRSKRKYNN